MSAFSDVPHPGVRIKEEVIPMGMSVTKAAQLLGVGRPALSNLLNGKASLSMEMAIRLERVFKYPRNNLMEMQAVYEADQAKKKLAPTETQAYVPPFLGVRANQIEDWVVHNIPARTRLSVFLRMLVHSTGIGLTEVNFPGNDDAERPGWDGFIEAGEGTPWIPAGRSGWEFGVDKQVKRKADHDYRKSVNANSEDSRKQTTFVFVTPRRWPRKDEWTKAAKVKGQWKDVRVFDASDLEQWVEQSLQAQAWFANETNIPAREVRSLDKCWSDWANAASPPLTGTLFRSALEAAKCTLMSRFSSPPNGPTILTADSTEEGLAFLAQLLSESSGEDIVPYRDRVLIFDKPGILPLLAAGSQTFIPVVHTREVERELAPFASSMHSILVYPRNIVTVDPHITLEPATYDTFNNALKEMGKDRDQIKRLANESGRSLTVLRRRLATVEGLRVPPWAADHNMAMRLVPFLFVGAWQSSNETDREGLSLLAKDRSYDALEQDVHSLAQLNDSPVWMIDRYRGVISKRDLLHAIASVITTDDLKRYFDIARIVLGEDDPALDLEEDSRWAAAIYGKTREFSRVFREGISETLVLLAVYGGALFKKRLGFDPEEEAASVVRDLLPTPLTTRVLEANDRDLPTYAEASPDEFLSILERDLDREEPATLGLLRPASNGIFGHPSRSGLLWALEGLAWNPVMLPRVVFILARLAQVEIDDNWVNKPMNSLQAIFRAWMPQTVADHDQLLSLMDELIARFPDIAWKICVSQFGTHDSFGEYSHKPRWRPDGIGFGEPCLRSKSLSKYRHGMVERALRWNEHTLETLTDLLDRLFALGSRHRSRIWTSIETWATTASDSDKAALLEKIRVAVDSNRATSHTKNNRGFPVLTGSAKLACTALEPSDLINRHAWLFRKPWVEMSADEIENPDFEGHEQRIQQMRVDAIREVHDQRGLSAILELGKLGETASQIGFYAARDVLSEDALVELLHLTLKVMREDKNAAPTCGKLITGALSAISDDITRENILRCVATKLRDKSWVGILLHAPFEKTTWNLVDEITQTAQDEYWARVQPDWRKRSDTEVNEAVGRLRKANRPRAAFSCVAFQLGQLEPQVLFDLLSDIAVGDEENQGEYLLEAYQIEEAFKLLDAHPSLTLEQMASLEFAFLDSLARIRRSPADSYGIPNLELYVEAHPELFVLAVVWIYKRRDDAVDPEAYLVPQDRQVYMAEKGRAMLEAIKRIPGHDELGVLQADRLANWIAMVRRASVDLSRKEAADICIGKLLANAPVGKDGLWPCEPVRQVMEDVRSESIMQGAHIGAYNARGAHWRGEGGNQDRELAEKYRHWGQSLQYSHPFLSSRLLLKLMQIYERDADREDAEVRIRRRLQ